MRLIDYLTMFGNVVTIDVYDNLYRSDYITIRYNTYRDEQYYKFLIDLTHHLEIIRMCPIRKTPICNISSVIENNFNTFKKMSLIDDDTNTHELFKRLKSLCEPFNPYAPHHMGYEECRELLTNMDN